MVDLDIFVIQTKQYMQYAQAHAAVLRAYLCICFFYRDSIREKETTSIRSHFLFE